MDEKLRRADPHAERINIPANPRHYWRYRMHLTLEKLEQAESFNATLRGLLCENGR
jgi:4-alpha-glucanotransferase